MSFRIGATTAFARMAKGGGADTVHRGRWIPNKGLESTVLFTVNCIYMKSLQRMNDTLESSVAGSDVKTWFRAEPQMCIVNVRSFSSLPTLAHATEYHNFLVYLEN